MPVQMPTARAATEFDSDFLVVFLFSLGGLTLSLDVEIYVGILWG
jgi:hypothetical protein